MKHVGKELGSNYHSVKNQKEKWEVHGCFVLERLRESELGRKTEL